MSIWYQHTVTCLAPNSEAIAKFLNLSSQEDVRSDRFTFSFGAKNGPGLRLSKVVEQNPDLIFLVKENIEIETVNWWIDRFDKETNTYQHIFLYTTGAVMTEVNKKILQEYKIAFPGLAEKHIAKEEGYLGFRWDMFFNYPSAADKLSRFYTYSEMLDIEYHLEDCDLSFDNDHSNLELDND